MLRQMGHRHSPTAAGLFGQVRVRDHLERAEIGRGGGDHRATASLFRGMRILDQQAAEACSERLKGGREIIWKTNRRVYVATLSHFAYRPSSARIRLMRSPMAFAFGSSGNFSAMNLSMSGGASD
jgi:hypothetical protein